MRRLAIIDVAQGRQPLTTIDGKFSIVFNGEIYNYREIKSQLEGLGHVFQTNSDTETLLLAYRAWGAQCLERLRGMFAFAILDHSDGSLFIARDRMGIKPLYYAMPEGKLVFASEIKSILEHPRVNRTVNPSAVDDYLALRYVPGPQTLIQGIYKLPPAHYMVWRKGEMSEHRYWTPHELDPWHGSFAAAQQIFDEIFDEATRLRMISERPVGAFLSGGLDSSAIVGSLAKQFPERLKTFSVGFGWEGDELSAAAQTAKRLGCEHREIICRNEDTALLPKIIWHLDEPVGDGIILPMYLLSRLASESVTVVQTGEGADEILGGYFMHRVMRVAALYRRFVPKLLRDKAVSSLVKQLPAALLNRLFDYPGNLGEAGKERLLEFLRVLNQCSSAEQYRFIISLFSEADRSFLYSKDFLNKLSGFDSKADIGTQLDFNQMLSLQFEHWLPDDILCKQDKISMANSLEGRVPFMDHKLVEFVCSLPANYKVGIKKNKIILRNYLVRNKLYDVAGRPKVPFYIPIDKYLGSGPLHDMVNELLSDDSVRRRGIFNVNAVQRMRSLHGNAASSSGFLYGKQIFSLAMLELWFRIFIDQEAGWI